MRKSIKREKRSCELPEHKGRVLARALAEDLRHACGGSATGGRVSLSSETVTDLGSRLDFTFRGGDGDSF